MAFDDMETDSPLSMLGRFSIEDIQAALRGDLFNSPNLPIKYVAQPGQTFGADATENAQPFSSIVGHHTGGPSLGSALTSARRGNPLTGQKLGYHFYIDTDGSVVQGAPMDARTNHVRGPGAAPRTARPDISNENAVGISFVGEKPNDLQIKSAENLSRSLMERFSITAENVVGHGEIQNNRRSTEGMPLVDSIRGRVAMAAAKPVRMAAAGGDIASEAPAVAPEVPAVPDGLADVNRQIRAEVDAMPAMSPAAPVAVASAPPAPQAGMLSRMWESLNRRPKTAEAPPDGGMTRSGSPLAAMFGGGEVQAAQAPAASSFDEAGFSAPATPNLPPSTNDPLSGEPEVMVDGVPLPRPKPVTPSAVASALAQPTVPPQGPPGAPMSLAPPEISAQQRGPIPPAPPFPGSAPLTGKGMLANLLSAENAPLLMAMAGGFAGAPSIGTGMRRAFSGSVQPAMAMRKDQVNQASQAETYRALIARGVPPQEALAAVRNETVMKATVAKYFETKPRQHVVIKDALGNETPSSFDPNTGKYFDAAGKEIKGADETGGASSSLLAPGVKFDANLSGDDYFNQFSKDVQAAAKAYMNGDVMPTGNPRQKAIASYAKTVAQRYGQDMGIPVSDSLFAERRKYRTELATNSANAAGGQAKAFNQAVEHADALATKLEQLGNKDPLGIPVVAKGVNWMREAFSTKQAGIAKEAQTIGQTLAGEVGKLFSGSQGGGVHERELTRKRFDTVTSPSELAGALEGTLETMEGGLRALEQRRDQVLGPNSNVNFVSKETHEKIARIKEVVKRLRGESPAVKPAAAPAKTSQGVTWSVVPQNAGP